MQGTAPILILKPLPPALGSDLHGKIKDDEQHFTEKSAAAKREFHLRQLEEKKAFEATPRSVGYWELRRLRRQFLTAQAVSRREFDAEQEKKRRTYQWRFP